MLITLFPRKVWRFLWVVRPIGLPWIFKIIVLVADALFVLPWASSWTECSAHLQLRRFNWKCFFLLHWADIPTGLFLSASLCLVFQAFSSQSETFKSQCIAVHGIVVSVLLVWMPGTHQSLSITASLSWTEERKCSGAQIGAGRDPSPITVLGKPDSTWGDGLSLWTKDNEK